MTKMTGIILIFLLAWSCSFINLKKMFYARLFSMRTNLQMQYHEGPIRFTVPIDRIFWDFSFPGYAAPYFTSNSVLSSPLADKELSDVGAKFGWNKLDGNINRVSYEGKYAVNRLGYPVNPMGRTGIRGRGSLLLWGVNHTVTCLMTRYKCDENGEEYMNDPNDSTEPSHFEFVAVQRRDNEKWQIPTAVLLPGEGIFGALKREILEDVFNINELPTAEAEQLKINFTELFNKTDVYKKILYKGYVDDLRNTDYAWIETVCIHVTCSEELESYLKTQSMRAGPDFKNAGWLEIQNPSSMGLHAGQNLFLRSYLNSKRIYRPFQPSSCTFSSS